jgi:hypothetical protein
MQLSLYRVFVMPEKMPKIQFTASLFTHNDKDTMLIRKELSDKEMMKFIFKRIIKDGKFQFYGEIIFVNRFQAILKLKERGLY